MTWGGNVGATDVLCTNNTRQSVVTLTPLPQATCIGTDIHDLGKFLFGQTDNTNLICSNVEVV